jgi:hypothetical protein
MSLSEIALMSQICFWIFIVVVIIALVRGAIINAYKISYYESKLEFRGVDIGRVKKIGIIEIFKS